MENIFKRNPTMARENVWRQLRFQISRASAVHVQVKRDRNYQQSIQFLPKTLK